MAYNSSGAGAKPGRNTAQTAHGLARPGGKSGNTKAPGAKSGKSLARPGYAEKAPKGGGSGSIARPGGSQSLSRSR